MQEALRSPMAIFAAVVIAVFILWLVWRQLWPSSPSKPSNPDKAYYDGPIQYFQPGRIVLHVEHPEDVDKEKLADIIGSFIKQYGQGQIKPEPKVLTLPLKPKDLEGLVFSLVFAQTISTEQKTLVQLLKDLYKLIQEQGEPIQKKGGPEERHFRISNDPLVFVRSASPNWLIGGAHHQPGTGGPATWPKGVSSSDPEADPSTNAYRFTFRFPPGSSLGQWCGNANAGEGIYVAILDTAPSQSDLITAYHERHESHPLIDQLLGPTGPKPPLHVQWAAPADYPLLMEYSLSGHRYRMPDHGLFIAGIIHTIAPKAELHLYEVLGPYGTGMLDTIAPGVLRALQEAQAAGKPLVINCSFALTVPLDPLHNAPDWDVDLSGLVGFTTISFRTLMEALTQNNEGGAQEAIVVAAAGNDATRSAGDPNPSNRPQARYPAAFDGVVGVGALPIEGSNEQFPKVYRVDGTERYDTATYSNFSDDPAGIGFVTLGGEDGPGKGVLGIYISDIPRTANPNGSTNVQYEHNESGWAWWAGTSFAAPIISGILAAGLSPAAGLRPQLLANPESVLSIHADTITTISNEHVINVIQG